MLAPKVKVDLDQKKWNHIEYYIIWKGMQRAVRHTFYFLNTTSYDVTMMLESFAKPHNYIFKSHALQLIEVKDSSQSYSSIKGKDHEIHYSSM